MEYCQFKDIIVQPFSRLLGGKPTPFKGGPVFPEDALAYVRHYRNKKIMDEVDTLIDAPDSLPAIPGSYVYAGPLIRHFGHFMAECCHRLWAFHRFRPEVDGIVYGVKPGQSDQLRDYPGFVGEALARFGIAPEQVKLVNQPTRFQNLIVPQQAAALWRSPAKEYLDFLARLDPQALVADDIPEKICVGRAHLIKKGCICGEDYLEQLLGEEGYFILRPENYPLARQWQYYANAKQIIFTEGSAIHGLELLPRLQAGVFVINRRPKSILAERVLGPRCDKLQVFDGISVIGIVQDTRQEPANALSRVDHIEGLLDALRDHGFAGLSGFDPEEFSARESLYLNQVATRL
ncbi:glycosyltransferase 61 family protein [Methylomagnum ishizawai]|uniref:glycosyltransferase 61 family protein n=1 Tax=Methylomagnum ishizawai TaxID=1760988 RepID=UPI001C3414E7|nr:glycosyltransferase 61 family protein [Methylomagnum ishizawai]BBL73059.1 hypothetical protein MishRS11D_01570 [Methylomagnum ishizawai]